MKPHAKIVAIDYGMKRIGLAISDEGKSIAFPWTTVTGGIDALIATLKDRLPEIESFVIGLPLLMNGTKGEMAEIVEKFAKEIEAKLDLPVAFLDERLSSKQADLSLKEVGHNRKKRAQKIDETAAMHLLQTHLMSRCYI